MLPQVFFISLIGFIILYTLRGMRMITFIPGGMITALFMTALISGLAWGILKTRRY